MEGVSNFICCSVSFCLFGFKWSIGWLRRLKVTVWAQALGWYYEMKRNHVKWNAIITGLAWIEWNPWKLRLKSLITLMAGLQWIEIREKLATESANCTPAGSETGCCYLMGKKTSVWRMLRFGKGGHGCWSVHLSILHLLVRSSSSSSLQWPPLLHLSFFQHHLSLCCSLHPSFHSLLWPYFFVK